MESEEKNSDRLRMSLIQNGDDFFNLKDEWNNLLECSDNNTIFLRWEWLYNWWNTYGGESSRLFILVVKLKNKILGIAPLFIKKYFFFNEIDFLGNNIVCSEYLDFITTKYRKKEIILLFILYIQNNKNLWDVMNLTDIPLCSQTLPVLESFFEKNNKIINKEYSVCPYIDLSGSFEKIFKSYRSIIRNTIRRKEKKINANGSIKYFEVPETENISEKYFKLVSLNMLRTRSKNIVSPFLSKEFFDFHHNVIVDLYKVGMAKICFLEVNNVIVAGIYLLLCKDKCFFYQSGFEPTVEKLSPGVLLFHHVVKSLHANGFKEFDFLRGDETYKKDWTDLCKVNKKIVIFNTSLKAKFLFSIRKYVAKIKSVLRSKDASYEEYS